MGKIEIKQLDEVLTEGYKETSRPREALQKPLKSKRLLGVYLFFFLGLLIILAQTGWLQIVQGGELSQRAKDNAIRIQEISAPRGEIFDQQGQRLVKNQAVFFYQGEKVSHQKAILLQQQNREIEQKIYRSYPFTRITSHILGYTNTRNQGKSGLELFYNKELSGQTGQEQVQVSAQGKAIKKTGSTEPHLGRDLLLHLDLNLQKFIYKNLPEDKKAAVVVLNPRNGGVLALVSKPGFDPNIFANNFSQEKYDQLSNDPGKPLFNRVLAGQYPPGSSIKPLVALAGLEQGLVDPQHETHCSGELVVRSSYNSKTYRFPDWKVHGDVDLQKAITQSCNVYFYKLGRKLGFEILSDYFIKFGLGQKLHPDLPYEEKGYIPQDGWLGDLFHAAIGQGEVNVTPLQMATATSVLSNGGFLWQSQVVDKLRSPEGDIKDVKPKLISKNLASLENIKLVRKSMQALKDSSLGWRLRDLPLTIAGKTGTAQFGPAVEKDEDKKYHAWFTSFYKDELVVTVLIEQGGSGTGTALPVAKKIYQWYYDTVN